MKVIEGADISFDPESEKNILQRISEERKKGQADGTIPDFMATPSYQMFSNKYVYNGDSVKDTYMRIAKCAAGHMQVYDTNSGKDWVDIFFNLLWKGWLSPSTPILANMGTERGCNVSCSGNYVGDSIYDFYEGQKETALLTQAGFGTSSYLGDIRPRGSEISKGGKASGVVPVFEDYVQVSRDVSQGSTRRGAWAGYLEIDHGDFFELADHIAANPDDSNVGWIITDEFINRLNHGDKDAKERFARSLKLKCITGKGYYLFIDKINRANPAMYKELGLEVKASNLCSEITLMSDENHTFTCVLASMNLAKYDEWKDTDAVYHSTIFLDCVAQEFIERGRNIRGLEKAVRFTEKSRALGLGVMGFHTYLQENSIPFEDFQAHMINSEMFVHLDKESLRASKWMQEIFPSPEWCTGYDVHNTHRLAIAPTTSTALIMGGVSRGIEPIVDNVYNETSAAGEIKRINPTLLKIMKERGVYNKKTLEGIVDNEGSVSHVDWLNDHEKNVFKTAFEIDQAAVLRLASSRQPNICQAQSLNTFFNADEDEAYIARIHQMAFVDENIKSLYYMRSRAGIQASKDSCEACSG